MNGRIWKKIVSYARQYTIVRITALFCVVPYIFIRNLSKWFIKACADSSFRRRVAVACATCLAITTVFSSHVYTFAESSDEFEVMSADESPDADNEAAPIDAAEPETDASAPTSDGSSGENNGDTETGEVPADGTAQETETGEPSKDNTAGDETVVDETSGETNEGSDIVKKNTHLTMSIVPVAGTQYEILPTEDTNASESEIVQEYSSVLSVTNTDNIEINGITLLSDVFDFIYKDPKDDSDGVSNEKQRKKKTAAKEKVWNRYKLSDPIPAGESVYIALVATTDEGVLTDEDGTEVSEFHIDISVSGNNVGTLAVSSEEFRGMQEFYIEKEISRQSTDSDGSDEPSDMDTATGSSAGIEDEIPAVSDDQGSVDNVEQDSAEDDVLPTPAPTEEPEIETEEEPAPEEETSDGETGENTDTNNVISVTLPTTFDIPMVDVNNSLQVDSDDIYIKNNSSFPIDVNISSVDTSIKQRIVDKKECRAVLKTDSDRVYDLDKIAQNSDIRLHLNHGEKHDEVYPLIEGKNTDIASFSLSEGKEEKPDMDAGNMAIMNLRGTIMDGIFFPGMRCDIKAQLIFEFNRTE